MSISMRVAPASRAFSTSSFDDRGRPFDHLAGRDLVDEFAGKNANGHADRSLQAISSP